MSSSALPRVLNFSSGPAMMPPAVVAATAAAIIDLDGSGIGLLEHSHRGPEFGAVLARTEASIRHLAAVPDDYAVLFVSAGATAHFTQIPRNFLAAEQTADYCHTGVWSGKAIEAAKRFGKVHLACSSEASKFSAIPTELTLSAAPRYVHFTSNNTIYGTQWTEPPAVGDIPLVCDASSDIFSRPIDISRYALLYAGAQKNLGPSGISLVIARRSFLATAAPSLAPLEDYRVFDHEKSMHNTPNTLGIFVIGQTIAWIAEQGGLATIGERNRRKAAVLYHFLDGSKLWRAVATEGSRSQMNVTFRASSPTLEEAFLSRAESLGFSGLRGHRSVGGLRASIYNAFPEAGVHALVAALAKFEREHTA
ncbi:MAG: 3-phosphoserine/phosphohydroxythreonine transaminase [Kofleriaceae bacterium]|nr:3-phosphoserine/phosphohydroxythreonine transaminase [Kofleriaceae bacterium]